MSGGYFDYNQHIIRDIAADICDVIRDNESTELDEFGCRVGKHYSKLTIARFAEAVHYLRLAELFAQRVDYLLSKDDGEDIFHKRLDEDILEYKDGQR